MPETTSTGGRAQQAPVARERSIFVKYRVVLFGIFLAALAECVAFVAGRILQAKWAMYRDPAPVSGQSMTYERYLQVRDPVLGWPREEEFGTTYAKDGARWCRDSGVPESADWLVSLYGDSFTADWVGGDDDHWGCRLEKQLGGRVRNYGVGGYGTDQAFLRYRENRSDGSRVVILAHMSADILRNVTRYRDFQMQTRAYAFKPRFVVGADDALDLIPIPRVSAEDLPRLLGLESPQLILDHENYHPNGPSGAVRLEFPFTWALVRNLGFYKLRSRLQGLPDYAELYGPQHPYQGAHLTAKIMLEFVELAEKRGQTPVLMVFPGQADLEHHRATGGWFYDTLLEELHLAGHEALNFGDVLEASWLSGRPVNDAFGTGDARARYHYNREASHLVADSVRDWLIEHGLLSSATTTGAN